MMKINQKNKYGLVAFHFERQFHCVPSSPRGGVHGQVFLLTKQKNTKPAWLSAAAKLLLSLSSAQIPEKIMGDKHVFVGNAAIRLRGMEGTSRT